MFGVWHLAGRGTIRRHLGQTCRPDAVAPAHRHHQPHPRAAPKGPRRHEHSTSRHHPARRVRGDTPTHGPPSSTLKPP
jgi:hypothetical protein